MSALKNLLCAGEKADGDNGQEANFKQPWHFLHWIIEDSVVTSMACLLSPVPLYPVISFSFNCLGIAFAYQACLCLQRFLRNLDHLTDRLGEGVAVLEQHLIHLTRKFIYANGDLKRSLTRGCEGKTIAPEKLAFRSFSNLIRVNVLQKGFLPDTC